MSGKNPATLPHLASKKEYVRFMLPEKEWLLSVDIYVYTYTNIYIQHLGTQHDWQSKKLSDNSWSDFSQIPFIHHIFSKYPCGNPQKPLQIFCSPRYQRNPIVPQDAEIFKWQLLNFVFTSLVVFWSMFVWERTKWFSGWWLNQPIWKIFSQNLGIFPK